MPVHLTPTRPRPRLMQHPSRSRRQHLILLPNPHPPLSPPLIPHPLLSPHQNQTLPLHPSPPPRAPKHS